MIKGIGRVGASMSRDGRRGRRKRMRKRRRKRRIRGDGAAKNDQLHFVFRGGNDLLHVLEGFPDEVYSVPFQNLGKGKRSETPGFKRRNNIQ